MFQIILLFVNLYHEFINTSNTSKLICLMTISLNLFGFVWVFECDVIGAIIKNLRHKCCLFGTHCCQNVKILIFLSKILIDQTKIRVIFYHRDVRNAQAYDARTHSQ